MWVFTISSAAKTQHSTSAADVGNDHVLDSGLTQKTPTSLNVDCTKPNAKWCSTPQNLFKRKTYYRKVYYNNPDILKIE